MCPSKIRVLPTTIEAVLALRDDYHRAVNAQIVHDSWHRRGFTTLYRFEHGSQTAGYGAVGGSPGERHDTVKEFYLIPAAAPDAASFFEAFLAAAQPKWLEAQTNDPFLAPLLSLYTSQSTAHTLLFADALTTALPAPDVRLRLVTPADHVSLFNHSTEPVGDWGLERDGTLVATGGLFFHYNPPYADLYMEVAPDSRRRGYASYLVQELKRIAYQGGHIPGARCQIGNIGSRGALERAGMQICASIRRGAYFP